MPVPRFRLSEQHCTLGDTPQRHRFPHFAAIAVWSSPPYLLHRLGILHPFPFRNGTISRDSLPLRQHIPTAPRLRLSEQHCPLGDTPQRHRFPHFAAIAVWSSPPYLLHRLSERHHPYPFHNGTVSRHSLPLQQHVHAGTPITDPLNSIVPSETHHNGTVSRHSLPL